MFDIGWSELLIIAIVALIVVGPKDLPILFRTVGRTVGRVRAMAAEFQREMERAAEETGVRDVAREFQSGWDDVDDEEGFDDEIHEVAMKVRADEEKRRLEEMSSSERGGRTLGQEGEDGVLLLDPAQRVTVAHVQNPAGSEGAGGVS